LNGAYDADTLPGCGLNRTDLSADGDGDLADAADLGATFDPPCDDTWCSFAADGPWSGPLTAVAAFTVLGLGERREDREVAEGRRRAGLYPQRGES
jgi:hypothetical protein